MSTPLHTNPQQHTTQIPKPQDKDPDMKLVPSQLLVTHGNHSPIQAANTFLSSRQAESQEKHTGGLRKNRVPYQDSIKGCSCDLRFSGPYHIYDTLLGHIILELYRDYGRGDDDPSSDPSKK